MSESCLNAGRGGRRGRERDSKALSRVCARRAALALPGRAREGARGPEARAGPRVLVGARMQRGEPGGRLGSASAARPRRLAELRLGPGGARRERRGRAAGGAPVRAAVRLHVTAAPSPARPGSGAFCAWEFCASSVPSAAAGGDRPSEKLPGRRGQGGCGGREGDSRGWGVNAALDCLSLSFSADLSQLSFPHRDSEGWIARRRGGRSRPSNCLRSRVEQS